MNEECSVNDIKNNTNTEDQETSTCNSKNPTDEPIQAPSNNDSTINHCSNSNESLSDSKNIVDGNPANMDQAVNENIEKSSDSDQAVNQNIEKSLDCNQAVNPDIEKSSDCDQAVNQNIEKSSDSTSEIHNTTDNADYEESEEIDSEEDSSDEEGSVGSEDARADTVSINSESGGEEETSPQSKIHNKDVTPIIIPDSDDIPKSQNGNLNGSPSSEVHEILSDNDDCISVNEDKSNRSSENENKDLRRSSRAIKRKTYDEMENGDCESDVEEVEVEDPLSCKTKPIVINNTKTLVQMAVKKIKTNNQKKEPTVVIIDTNSKKGPTTQIKNPTPMNNSHNIVPNLMARGTTVTPVSSKVNSSPQIAPQNPQPSILPSLTDDMFVVEAPSFIVPYVYEKPSIKAFREFVDKLGKELEEHKAKEEQERLEKEKIEKEKRDKEKRERRERGELVEESEDEKNKTDDGEDEKKKKKAEKKERRRRRNDDDDASWDGESSSDSEEDIISDDDTVVLKDKASSIEDIKDVSNLTAEKVGTGKSDNYFECSLGKFFVNIGMNMVQEYVQNDLLKQQNRKLYREKKSGHSTKATQSSIASLMKNLEFSKENNAPYTFPQTKCEFCSFKTESALVMSQHLETPHMKNNFYKCNFCEYEIRSPHDILYHMEAEHNVRGKLERAPAYHQCANCPFEDNGKGKLARHQIACAKKYKPELNLAPAVEWEPPAKIPKITRARNSMMGSYQSAFQRQLGNNMGKGPIPFASLMPPVSGIIRARGRSPLSGPMRAGPVHGIPIARAGVSSPARHHSPSPALMGSNYSMATNAKPRPTHQPSISITPLPRQPQPVQQQSQHSKSTFVICEICDGYIKDLEQLRNHMQWIHKVKIHPKMIYNRPPLNCQKCQFRFFTDQGLERHLLGSHGLVTSSMQEAANKGKDAGRCPVCGRVYQWKLLNHVARDHNLTLKPAHLSYKCTVCTATFGMYKQFENHVYSAHSVVAKRVMDKSKTSTSSARGINDMASLKPLKINDEITITPQPVKAATSKTK